MKHPLYTILVAIFVIALQTPAHAISPYGNPCDKEAFDLTKARTHYEKCVVALVDSQPEIADEALIKCANEIKSYTAAVISSRKCELQSLDKKRRAK